MALVIVNLTSEYLPDGSFHVCSPEVPGFHVVEPPGSKVSHKTLFHEKIRPRLTETMQRRVAQAKVGSTVWFREDLPVAEVRNFIPEELRRRLGGKPQANGIPALLIAEIK
jgi:hypothetical protein